MEQANAILNHQPLSLIMVDIDYFKQYNDHYGHIAGDDCFKQVAEVLNQAATRLRHFLARFGGEAFILILPKTDQTFAYKVAERCCQLIFRVLR